MPKTHRFPFTRLVGDTTYRPYLPVTIINPANTLDDFTWAMIDTGADRSAFPEYIAKKIYHDIKNKKVKTDYIETAGGCIKVYKHTFTVEVHAMSLAGTNIKIGGPVIKIPNMFVDVVPLTTENEYKEKVHTSFNQILLGVEDFMEEYVLTIDYPNRTFSFRK